MRVYSKIHLLILELCIWITAWTGSVEVHEGGVYLVAALMVDLELVFVLMKCDEAGDLVFAQLGIEGGVVDWASSLAMVHLGWV